jgi:DNA-binding transcriptional MerR regulator
MSERADEARGLRISEVSTALGVPIATIRSWERRYGFPSPSRTFGSHRRFTLEHVDQLRALRDLVTSGHPAREAVELVRARGGRGFAESEAAAEMVEAARRLDPGVMRSTLDEAVERAGVEAVISTVIFPALRQIGSAWAVGECDVGQEHVTSQVVRAWLGRHLLLAPPAFRARPVVLACGPDEDHSIGVESFAVVLARRGWPCVVLGASTPTEALLSAVRRSEAAAVVLTAQRSVGRLATVRSLRAVVGLDDVRAFYAGAAFEPPRARRDVVGSYLGDDVMDAAATFERVLGDRSE